MIRTIKEIWIYPLDDATPEWSQLHIIPGTATITIETSSEDSGRLMTYNLSATLRRPHPALFRNLRLRIIYDNGRETFGTKDLPVRFDSQRDNRLVISVKYKTRARY